MRVKRGTTAQKHRRNVLKQTKGYQFGRGSKEREAKVAILHAGNHAFNDRRNKKGDFRRIWQIKINAAVRSFNISYSVFIDALKKSGVELDRKILADLAENNPKTFERVVKHIS